MCYDFGQWRARQPGAWRSMGWGIVGFVLLTSVLCGQEPSAPGKNETAGSAPVPAAPTVAVPKAATDQDSASADVVPGPSPKDNASAPSNVVPEISVATAPETAAPPAGIAPPPVGAGSASQSGLSPDLQPRWWITEEVSRTSKDQPGFLGVRLAHAPRAMLVETPTKIYHEGDTITMRLWGFNDFQQEFKGWARTLIKQGPTTLQIWEGTVRLAPSRVERIAEYNYKIAEMAVGQYKLEVSLLDQAGKLRQQQVTPITVLANADLDGRRQAKARQEAERKIFEEARTKYLAVEQAAVAALIQAMQRQEAECRVRVTQAEMDQKTAEASAAALKLEAQAARVDAEAKAVLEKQAKQAAKQDGAPEVKAKREAEAQAAREARKQAAAAAKAKEREAEKAADLAEDKAEITSAARSALTKQQKNMARQKADLEAQAVRKAEQKAKDAVKAQS